MHTHTRLFPRRTVLLASLFVGLVFQGELEAIDRVILRDGFELIGRMGKEQERIVDGQNGTTITVSKSKGFDYIDDGIRYWLFSRHHKQVAQEQQNVKTIEDLKEFTRPVSLKQSQELPGMGKFKADDFNKDWKRVIKVETLNGNWQEIHQHIATIGPRRVVIPSTTHRWYPYYSTREYSPLVLRSLLSTHPELDEKGKPDAMKRIAMAKFFYQADYLDFARSEIERAKKDIPGEWTKDQTAALDKLKSEISRAEAKLVSEELELANQSARYDAAKKLVALFDDKVAAPDAATRFTTERAKLELLQPQFEKTALYLRSQIQDLAAKQLDPPLAVLGGVGGAGARKQLPAQSQQLLAAAETVLAELHPDNVDRIDIFRKLAEDVEKLKKTGAGSGGGRAAELLSLAISGWALGPNGAVNLPETALRQWQLREALLAYQNEDIQSNRKSLFARILKAAPNGQNVVANAELLSQMIKYLPPSNPEDLTNPTGQAITASEKVVSGIWRKNTGPISQAVSGVDYLLRLPSEYHHGRSYPVVIALTHNTIPAEQLVTLLSSEADRRGYILVAPLWAGQFDNAYDWKGDQHHKVTASLRNLMRRYNVDNNRVFLFGFGEGANFAIDMGASHPDLFAGVTAMAPNPKWQGAMMHYWRNCQKLPVLVTMGALAGNAMANVKHMYENWMMKGYPSLAAIYRGRAMEWFGGDLPVIFDWMKNKKRATGVATLRLNNFAVEPWIIMRPQDNRFYWVGTDSIRTNHLMQAGSFVPAEIKADIAQGNEIRISTLGLNSVTIWFDREMIDWSKPVSVRINGDIPRGYRPAILQPDIEVMLEQFYQHGDRSMLFLNKLTFTP